MSFQCPVCKQSNSLKITHSLELLPDSRSDEITLQVVACIECGFEGTAVYEASRRGHAESWEHTGYKTPADQLHELKNLINQCPAPQTPKCACPAHQALNQHNKGGRWLLPVQLANNQPFPMILHWQSVSGDHDDGAR
ncbi:MAG: hypothetical protein D6706_02020 [Chloroflexi bacterium]|nr:MAG: hypothetical protein D6706_02020 [Chloroflexota bacterium]